jgi:hypothetical protein
MNFNTQSDRPKSGSRKRTPAATATATSSSKAGDSGVPENKLPSHLVEEIDDLVEKEKTLLELKLLEKEVESENWKTKYTDLKEKVIEDIQEDEQDVNLLETIAEIEAKEAGQNYYVPSDPHLLLATRIDHHVANFSSINFTRFVFFQVMKELFQTKGANNTFSAVNVLLLDHCNLDDEYADALYSAFKNPRLEGIDLSHNLLNGDMMYNITSILSVREEK